jgi:hypothetical protein
MLIDLVAFSCAEPVPTSAENAPLNPGRGFSDQIRRLRLFARGGGA